MLNDPLSSPSPLPQFFSSQTSIKRKPPSSRTRCSDTIASLAEKIKSTSRPHSIPPPHPPSSHPPIKLRSLEIISEEDTEHRPLSPSSMNRLIPPPAPPPYPPPSSTNRSIPPPAPPPYPPPSSVYGKAPQEEGAESSLMRSKKSEAENVVDFNYYLELNNKRVILEKKIKKDPSNINLLFDAAINEIEIISFCRENKDKKNKHYLGNKYEYVYQSLIFKINKIKELNPLDFRYYLLNGLTQQARALVNLNELLQLEIFVKSLTIAKALNPHHEETNFLIKGSCHHISNYWNTHLDDPFEYQNRISLLKRWLAADRLEELFAENPSLFKLTTSPIHFSFFSQHPQFRSLGHFLNRYPGRGLIRISEELSKDQLQQMLIKATSNPLIINIRIKDPFKLTPELANEFKEAMLNFSKVKKVLHLVVSDASEVQLIIMSFKSDETLNHGKGNLIIRHIDHKHVIEISTVHPFLRIKEKPLPES